MHGYADEAEEEDGNKEYIEETNRDAVMISAAKLVASDAVPKVYVFNTIWWGIFVSFCEWEIQTV